MVLNTIDLTGVSNESWDDAAREALREASRTIRRITKMEVTGSRAVVAGRDIAEYHTDLRIYFEIESTRG